MNQSQPHISITGITNMYIYIYIFGHQKVLQSYMMIAQALMLRKTFQSKKSAMEKSRKASLRTIEYDDTDAAEYYLWYRLSGFLQRHVRIYVTTATATKIPTFGEKIRIFFLLKRSTVDGYSV